MYRAVGIQGSPSSVLLAKERRDRGRVGRGQSLVTEEAFPGQALQKGGRSSKATAPLVLVPENALKHVRLWGAGGGEHVSGGRSVGSAVQMFVVVAVCVMLCVLHEETYCLVAGLCSSCT
jgi:hypothetical protein